MDSSEEAARGYGVSRRAVDAGVGALALLIGAAVMYDSWRLGAGWANGTPQPGYFPLRIGAIICIASVSVIVRALLAGRAAPEAIFTRWEEFRPVLAVLVPTVAYVAITQLLGIYTASALFIAAFMRVAGKYGWLKSLLVGAGTAIALFWIFEMEFLVPLPKGPVEQLFGY